MYNGAIATLPYIGAPIYPPPASVPRHTRLEVDYSRTMHCPLDVLVRATGMEFRLFTHRRQYYDTTLYDENGNVLALHNVVTGEWLIL